MRKQKKKGATDMKNVMKKLKEFFGTWEIIATAFVLAAIGWYLSGLIESQIFFAFFMIVIAVVAGYALSRREKEKQKQCEEESGALHQAIEKVKENLLESDNRIREQLTQELETGVTIACDKLSETEKKLENVLVRNEEKRQNDVTKIDETLKSLDASFVNAVEAYQEMESRMVALELQNVHLQLLTTMMGSVRSDVAQLNEVKGFAEEHKMGRKVRIIRDDEHGIIVENLMNSDGVGIEKSKMFKGKHLAFEASFDATGKMLSSISYDENGNPSTEITYYSETIGGPTLRDLAKDSKDRFVSFLNKMGVYPRR